MRFKEQSVRSESAANQSLVDSKERKQAANDKFWSRVLFICNLLAILLIAVGLYRIFKG